MSSVAIEGGCLCRAIRYRLNAEPLRRSLCHCRSCRLAAGAPTVAWIIMRATDVEFTAGQPRFFQSSPGIRRSFCGQCGTSLTWQREDQTETLDFTTATLDDPGAFPPDREIWTAHRIGWESLNPSCRQYPGSSREVAE
jgi:hypothetical protein